MEENNKLALSQSAFLVPEKYEQFKTSCRALANSELVPDMYKISPKNPEAKAVANCMIALDMADRMGANPLMVMQNLYIVYGRPGWSSSFLIATVNNCGRFKPLKFKHGQNGEIEYNGKKYPNYTCYAYTTEKNDSDELIGTEISLEMAKAEGWLTKNGSKWMTMPKQMLMYRAASFWQRTYAPEISMGFRTMEENEDMPETIDTDYEELKPAKPTAAQKAAEVLARHKAQKEEEAKEVQPTDEEIEEMMEAEAKKINEQSNLFEQ